MKLFMSFSTLVTVTVSKIYKYLDMLLTDGIYWNNHTEYVSYSELAFSRVGRFQGFLPLK